MDSSEPSCLHQPKQNHYFNKSQSFGVDLDNALRSSINMVKQEEKLESARKRRENIRNMRTKRVMNSSRKHSEISTRVRQSKFVDDIDRQEQAQYMRQSNQNHVMMRKIYLGLMDQIHDLKKEERAHVIYSIYILQLKLYLIF